MFPKPRSICLMNGSRKGVEITFGLEVNVRLLFVVNGHGRGHHNNVIHKVFSKIHMVSGRMGSRVSWVILGGNKIFFLVSNNDQ